MAFLQQWVAPERFGFEKLDSINYYTQKLVELNQKVYNGKVENVDICFIITSSHSLVMERHLHINLSCASILCLGNIPLFNKSFPHRLQPSLPRHLFLSCFLSSILSFFSFFLPTFSLSLRADEGDAGHLLRSFSHHQCRCTEKAQEQVRHKGSRCGGEHHQAR